MRKTVREIDGVRRSLAKGTRQRLTGTAEEIAALPVQTLRALEKRGLAAKRGQRWKLTSEGRMARVLERQQQEGVDG